jgi:hypothetical protein
MRTRAFRQVFRHYSRVAPQVISMLCLGGKQTSRKQFAAEFADAGGFVKSPKDEDDYCRRRRMDGTG